MIIEVRVKPNARESRLDRGDDGVWTARLKSAPIEGRANAELIVLVAEAFGVARRAVTIRAGASGRTKLVAIATT